MYINTSNICNIHENGVSEPFIRVTPLEGVVLSLQTRKRLFKRGRSDVACAKN